jgi:lincosamide nucleotidyltransferase B/F
MRSPKSELLLQRLEAIGTSLEQSGKALALIALGSVGAELERLDEYSDLDFFAIVQDGCKTEFLTDLGWLTKLEPVAYAFQNTEDGFKLLYADDVFCEFAVFELHELANASFTAGRIVWKAAHIPDSIVQSTMQSMNRPSPKESRLEHSLGEALTNLYIGVKRFARGEQLSAARFVQQYAVDRVIELAESLEAPQNALRDPFSRERRLEQRLPVLAGQLGQFIQGYERTPSSALALLAWLEKHFDVNIALAQAIRDEVKLLETQRS